MIFRKAPMQLVLICLLAGCRDDHAIHSIGEKGIAFCVPEEYEIDSPTWLPEDSSNIASGFAFRGCRELDALHREKCPFPVSLISGVVTSSERHPPRRWRDFPPDAFYRQLASDSSTRLELIESDDSIIMASNVKLSDSWYVWRKAKAITGRTKIEDDDTLLAVCRNGHVRTTGKLDSREVIFCDRYALGQGYSFNYHFESRERAPQDMEALDKKIAEQIDNWRCKANTK